MNSAKYSWLVGFAALAFLFMNASVAQSYNGTNMTNAINSTAIYISKVNQSAYIVFYPNLAQAYQYLGMAKNESSMNQSLAYALLAKARQSANAQELMIARYQNASVYVLVILTVFLAIILYVLMKPRKLPTLKGNKP